MVAAVGQAGVLSGPGGVALGIVAAYGQRLARLYAAVSITVLTADNSKMDEAVRKVIAGMICEVAKNIALGVFSSAGKIAGKAAERFAVVTAKHVATAARAGKVADGLGAADNTLSLLGAPSPFSCPL